MNIHSLLKFTLVGAVCSLLAVNVASAYTPVQTTNSATLSAALGGDANLTITAATALNGNAGQFGTYTGFSAGPVTIANGIILSTGNVLQTTPAFNNGTQGASTTPSTNYGSGGTAEFNAYGPGHITNFSSSNDVAKLTVSFTLTTASQIGFDFIFGSVEAPQFTSNYTDSFLAFLDGFGTPNQIVFDASNNAVQVGASFAGADVTTDLNTAFANPHSLLKLSTLSTAVLSAGAHTITFEIGDVNDGILDSAAFITNLHAATGQGGTIPTTPDAGGTCALLGLAMAGLAALRRKLA